MVKKIQRTNNISLKLSDDEKKRVAFFAGQRDLTIAEYLRMTALGHKIKPTIVEWSPNDKEQERSKPSNDLSPVEPEENELRIELTEEEIEVIKAIADLTASSNGYIDYRQGGELMLKLKELAKRF